MLLAHAHLQHWATSMWTEGDHGAGAPVAFKLMPEASPPMYALPSSSHAQRGIFATKNLWVSLHCRACSGQREYQTQPSSSVWHIAASVAPSTLLSHER